MRALVAMLLAVIGIGVALTVGRDESRNDLAQREQSQDERRQGEQVQWVWARLLDSGWPQSVPQPTLVYSARAWVHSQATGEVIYGPHLLLANEDEIAFALAHELAHLLLAHHGESKEMGKQPASVMRLTAWRAELEADARARHLMQRAGFNERGIASYFERHAPVASAESMHPPHARRLSSLGLSYADLATAAAPR